MTDQKDSKLPSALTRQNTTLDKQREGAGIKLPGLHARLRDRSRMEAVVNPNTVNNRLALMVDVSGSMGGKKIQSLIDATTGFITACDMSNTSLAIEPFGDDYPSPNRVSLTTVQPMLMTTVQLLRATGGTPMARAMDYVLGQYSITRGVLVSDGQPDNEQACYDAAMQYKEAGIMIDCVHIDESSHGEACLRRIAEITGGQFIKFTDVTSFAKNFKYLTPAYYGILTSGSLSASDLGAKELK